ncbi:MAG: FAD-binding oxidoreductase [Pseudomonadota bacterium]
MTSLDSLVQVLEGMAIKSDPVKLRQKSRDFFWYSPVLKRQLDHISADLIVEARNEADVIRVLAACHAHNIPVTVRGGGSGNYGQAMPLEGGVVLDLSKMDRITSIKPGRVCAEAGARLSRIDEACQVDSGQELRFHPSTLKMGTIGGFVAGGSSGIGSITWGLLRDPGNILMTRVVTMEAEPRVLELEGRDIQKVNHAYGTNGVITELAMPLAPAYDWVDIIVGFDDFMDAVRFADALAHEDGILKKLIAPLAAPIGERYFRPLQSRIPKGQSLVLLMIADIAMADFSDVLGDWPGTVLLQRKASDPKRKSLPIYELSWNHTTLHALKIDPTITYLQVLYPPGEHLDRVQHMHETFGEEVMSHLEFVRFGGKIACFGLPLVAFTSEERLDEIIRYHEDNGCPIFNPHAFTLEEGGMKAIDRTQLVFKREADPKGLLNPGKMLGFDDPDYDGSDRTSYLYRSLDRA